MKLLYIAKFSFENKEDIGILKKIFFQKKSLKNNGLIVNMISTDYKKVHYNKKIIKQYKNNYIAKLKWIYDSLNKKIIDQNDIFYIRNSSVDFGLILALKKIKNKKIIIEIPTYPYDGEKKIDSFKNLITILSDRISRKFLKKYIYKVVTYSEDSIIWGIPCINISNGIDLEEIKIIDKKNKKEDKIVFTSVSNCSFWHGIDRFLLSLEKYGQQEKKKEIIFNIIGEGADLNSLEKIVDKSKYLSKVVKFQGFKMNQELDDIYNETDIGLGSLGRHRSGIHTMRALKNREYCAKGIPMIFSEDDPDLRDVPFVYHVTPDEELIDIEKLIEWYENINLESKDIRRYAEKFSWDIQMKKVIDEIEKI